MQVMQCGVEVKADDKQSVACATGAGKWQNIASVIQRCPSHSLAVAPHTVDWSLVAAEPKDEAESLLNGQYAISVARKIGACVFLTAEDIFEVRG